MRPARALLHLCWIVPAALAGLYLVNPAGVPTWDPRGRLVGVIPYRVPADSMSPTFPDNSLVAACTWAYVGALPERGDVIVFRPPHDPDMPYMKRVVGLEGESIRFEGDTLYVDGIAQDEPYRVAGDRPGDDLETVVPNGHVFVAGDHRSRSYDSRQFGPVSMSAIVGKICATL